MSALCCFSVNVDHSDHATEICRNISQPTRSSDRTIKYGDYFLTDDVISGTLLAAEKRLPSNANLRIITLNDVDSKYCCHLRRNMLQSKFCRDVVVVVIARKLHLATT